jgi:hypothetical protein
MGTVGGNGGGWPPDGGGGPPDDLPELPPEWGEIVVPDDPAALAEEAALVRRELESRQRRDRWRQVLGLPPRLEAARPSATGGLRAPLLVMAIAVLVTLASLFAATWPGPQRPAPQRSGGTVSQGRSLPALDLVDAQGATVPLRGALPAVIMLVDGCDCAALVAETAAARPDITVVTVVTGALPSVPPRSGAAPPSGASPAPSGAVAPTAPVRHLADPAGELRKSLNLGPPDGTAGVLLVTDSGEILRTLSRTASVENFRADLSRL